MITETDKQNKDRLKTLKKLEELYGLEKIRRVEFAMNGIIKSIEFRGGPFSRKIMRKKVGESCK